uniref:Fibronectin type-III domain-containing protein n=1 Tax=Taenia asiatica TaxID=60517 RepID=A0A0R3VVY4_TAEAS
LPQKSAKRAEEDATVKFDCLIQTIEAKKAELISAIKEERDRKLGALKEQIHQCTSKLTRSTGLIQFCIEMLKENDAFSFLLVSQSLINRVLHTEQSFLHAIETPPAVLQYCPRTQPTGTTTSGQSHPSTPAHWVKGRSAPLAHSSFVSLMQLDAIHKVISDLSLHEGIDDQLIDCSASSASSDCEVPNAPVFRAEECLSEGNIITLVWQPCLSFGIDYYTLEIDDGAGGAFRKVYRGIETMCTIEGLHFKSMYRARVKAHNPSGYSAYSDRLVIQTSTHSWFHMDPSRSSVGGLQFSNSNRSLTCQSMEDCVALASTGLSRGIHYWEFVIDRLDAGGQPSFGIAKSDCNKEAMLGSMYPHEEDLLNELQLAPPQHAPPSHLMHLSTNHSTIISACVGLAIAKNTSFSRQDHLEDI